MFFVCFGGAQVHLQRRWSGPTSSPSAPPEKAQLVYTHGLEYLFTQIQVAAFGAGFLAFPIIANEIYKFVAPGLYKNERQAFLPYLVATPVLFTLGALVVYFIAMPLLMRFSVGMQQLATERRPASSSCRRSASTCRSS